ncbi:MAG: hypothetical protein Q9164_006907 [Protoblastenia rupestris]
MLRDDIDPAILVDFYRQVARFLLELADVEFSSVGTIVEEEDMFGVESGPTSVKMNDIERQDGISLRASIKPFKTTTEFFEHVLSLDMEHLRFHPGSVRDREDARRKYRRLRKLMNLLPRLVDPA